MPSGAQRGDLQKCLLLQEKVDEFFSFLRDSVTGWTHIRKVICAIRGTLKTDTRGYFHEMTEWKCPYPYILLMVYSIVLDFLRLRCHHIIFVKMLKRIK